MSRIYAVLRKKLKTFATGLCYKGRLRMHKFLLSAIAAAGLIFATGSTARAQAAVFGFDDHNGSPSSGTYMPGDSFTFSITLGFAPGGNVANVDGLSYWMEQQNPSAPFYFSITNRDVTGSMFTDLQTPHIVYPQNMTPQSASDLGAFLPGTGIGAGAYFIANLTIKIDPSAAPGIYQIESTDYGREDIDRHRRPGAHLSDYSSGLHDHSRSGA